MMKRTHDCCLSHTRDDGNGWNVESLLMNCGNETTHRRVDGWIKDPNWNETKPMKAKKDLKFENQSSILNETW
jgi:hypothetical protein